MPSTYPVNPVTIGEHIRKKRIELKLLQSDVAKVLKVSADCVTNWENNRSNPQIKYNPQILEFLGYNPFPVDESTFSGLLKAYRWRNGLCNKKMAKLLKVNGSTVLAWENEQSKPSKKHLHCLKLLLK